MLDTKNAIFISAGIAGGVIIAIVIPPFWAVLICGCAIFFIIRFLSEWHCHHRR